MADFKLSVEITAAVAKAENSLKSLQKSTKQFGDSVTNVGKNLSSVFGTLGAGAFFGKIIKDASDAEETANKFSVVFSDVAERAAKASKDLSDNFGLSATAAATLLSDTGDLLTGFGFTGEAALELSNNVQELAVDLASFTNFSGGAEGASAALTKALLGETESLKSLGIAINQDAVAKKVNELATQGVVFENERLAKAQATLLLATEQSKNAIGDFSRSQDSFANRSRELRARLSELSEEFGKILLPVVTKLSEIVADLATTFRDSSAGIKILTISLVGLAGVIGPLLVTVGTLIKLFSFSFGGVAIVINTLSTAFVALRARSLAALVSIRTGFLTARINAAAFFTLLTTSGTRASAALALTRGAVTALRASIKLLAGAATLGLALAITTVIEQFSLLSEEGFSFSQSLEIILDKGKKLFFQFSATVNKALNFAFGSFTDVFLNNVKTAEEEAKRIDKNIDDRINNQREKIRITEKFRENQSKIAQDAITENTALSEEERQKRIKEITLKAENELAEARRQIQAAEFEGQSEEQIDALELKLSQKLRPVIEQTRKKLVEFFNETGDQEALAKLDTITSSFNAFDSSSSKGLGNVVSINQKLKDTAPQQAASGLANAFQNFANGTESAKKGFENFAKSFLSNIANMITQQLILNSIQGFIGAKEGGSVQGGTITRAEGGSVFGAGTSTSDSIPARLSNGEFVVKAKTAKAIGHNTLNAINNLGQKASGIFDRNKFAMGGSVGNVDSIASSSGPLEIKVDNRGSEKQASRVTTERDARGTVINIVLDDIESNGPINRAIKGVR